MEYSKQKNSLQIRLHDAVKQCQMQFGAKRELATSGISCVSCLCSAWEGILLHGLKRKLFNLIGIKQQFTEIPGIGHLFQNDLDSLSFWNVIRHHLNKDERERFVQLKNIRTDIGRSRAWLRASLNEHTLERYVNMILSDTTILREYYEPHAFILDTEQNSVLPNLAAGVNSILFALEMDTGDLNAPVRVPPDTAPNSDRGLGGSLESEESPLPVVVMPDRRSGQTKPSRRKKVINKVSFDDDDSTTHSDVSSLASPFTFQVGSGSGAEIRRFKFDEWRVRSLKEDAQSVKSDCGVMGVEGTDSDSEFTRTHKRVASDNVLVAMATSDAAPNDQSDGEEMGSVPVVSSASSFPPQLQIESTRPGRSESFASVSSSCSRLSAQLSMESFDVGIEAGEDVLMPLSGSTTFSLPKADSFSPEVPPIGDLQRTQGDGGNWLHGSPLSRRSVGALGESTFSTDELRSALLDMIDRKDAVEAENRNMISLLDEEKTRVAALEEELANTKKTFLGRQEKDNATIQSLRRDNDLLKHQLKKYVSTVQALRPGDSEVEQRWLEHTSKRSQCGSAWQEAEVYESRLVELAQMHAELLEMNEHMRRELTTREAQLEAHKRQLRDLRGPLADWGVTEEGGAVGGVSMDLWIPGAFKKGSGQTAHHVYQIYLRVGEEDWNVYRRYSEFHSLHKSLNRSHPAVGRLDFPPKQVLGRQDGALVEARRRRLQTYLRHLVRILLQSEPLGPGGLTKRVLGQRLPFLASQLDDHVLRGT